MGTTTLTASDGHRFATYRAAPREARRGGLVICHAIWGVTPHLRALADEWAGEGYEVIVPSLFDRFREPPGPSPLAVADTDPALMAEQMALGEASGWGRGCMADVQAAVAALAAPVFLMGFCFGGTTAWLAAARVSGLAAVASFYGGQVATNLGETPRVPTILHLGKHDELIPPSEVEAITTAFPDLPVYLYDAGHAFVAPGGHHADSARLALLRTRALFARSNGAKEHGA